MSEARKARPDPRVTAWFDQVRADQLFLSVLVLGELRQGVENIRRRDTRQALRLSAWLERLADDYAERILPVTFEIAMRWGRLNAGNPLPVVDGLLAATALHHELTVVTRNAADFERSGVPILNPFNEP